MRMPSLSATRSLGGRAALRAAGAGASPRGLEPSGYIAVFNCLIDGNWVPCPDSPIACDARQHQAANRLLEDNPRWRSDTGYPNFAGEYTEVWVDDYNPAYQACMGPRWNPPPPPVMPAFPPPGGPGAGAGAAAAAA